MIIDSFRDQYVGLSNFCLCPVKYEGDMYPSDSGARSRPDRTGRTTGYG